MGVALLVAGIVACQNVAGVSSAPHWPSIDMTALEVRTGSYELLPGTTN